MKQKIVRSKQNGMTRETDRINDYLNQGWVVVSSHVVPANDNIYGYIEYVLEYRPHEEEKNENHNL